jgi:hypothetical protein
MKKVYCALVASAATILSASSQTVVERGPHHNVVQYIEAEDVDGQTQFRTNEVTQLGTGINYWDDQRGTWLPSSNEIEFLQSGAAYTKGQFKLFFASNLNDPNGNLEWFPTPNDRVVIQTVGIAMREVATGNAVFIAQIKDAQGFLTAPNEITYPSCFDNIDADVRISVNPFGSGFENDVILHEAVPDPAIFGFQGDCRIEVWHEVLAGPAPELQPAAIQRSPDKVDADSQLRFGSMTLGPGTAFLIGADSRNLNAPSDIPVRVAKQYVVDQQTQMRFIVEALPLADVGAQLRKLQRSKGAFKLSPGDKSRMQAAWNKKSMRPVALAERRTSDRSKVAAITRKDIPLTGGLVLDYTSLVDQSNYTLRGDTTYLVGANTTVNLSGTTVIEPGCVIKFDSYNSANGTPVININGALDCRTRPYAPCVLTARDDRNVGETNTASAASVASTPYGAYHLKFPASNANPIQLHDIRSRFAQNAFGFLGTGTFEAWNIQVYGAQGDVFQGAGNTITLRNILVNKANNIAVTTANNTVFKGEHVTVHSASKTFNAASFTGCTFNLTNSLLVVVTNSSSSGLTTVSSHTLADDSGVFQALGNGAHYLASNSPYRNSGSMDVSTNLTQGVFKYSTTYAPILLPNNFTVNTTLAPQALRDLDQPDEGYHYPALDWIVGGLSLANNVTLTLTNGVALGYFSTIGITMSGGSFISEGRPLQLNRIVRYNVVQEQPPDWGSVGSTMRFLDIPNAVTTVSLRLTEIDHLAYSQNSIRNSGVYQTSASAPSTFLFRDCEMYSSYFGLTHSGSGSAGAELRNNLFHRSYFGAIDGSSTLFSLIAYNNLFRGGAFSLYYNSTLATWSVYNNLFDTSSISLGNKTPSNGQNGYIATSALLGGTGNKTVNSGDYQIGVQGRWYYPITGSNLATLIDSGSMSAGSAQLYHYTTRTDHAKDNGTVDIGYHYVAIDANGPIDSDGDGIPDYLEDRNGNGTADTGEYSWTSAMNSSGGLTVYTPFQP